MYFYKILSDKLSIFMIFFCLKVAFFRKCFSFFRSPNLKRKKYSRKLAWNFWNLNFKLRIAFWNIFFFEIWRSEKKSLHFLKKAPFTSLSGLHVNLLKEVEETLVYIFSMYITFEFSPQIFTQIVRRAVLEKVNKEWQKKKIQICYMVRTGSQQ